MVAADSDSDDSVTGYAITGGADMALFEIGVTSGALTFKSAPNFEDPQDSGTDNVHEVTVQATSGTDTREMTATQTIAVTVTDADEQSAKPDKPELEAVSGSSTSLTATWETPDKNGGPAITGYKLEYKLSTETSWTAFAHTGTAGHHDHHRADGGHGLPGAGAGGERRDGQRLVGRLGRGEHECGDGHPDLHAERRRPLVRRGDGGSQYLGWKHVLRLLRFF